MAASERDVVRVTPALTPTLTSPLHRLLHDQYYRPLSVTNRQMLLFAIPASSFSVYVSNLFLNTYLTESSYPENVWPHILVTLLKM